MLTELRSVQVCKKHFIVRSEECWSNFTSNIFSYLAEFTKGRLFARVGWARGIDGQILSPPVDQWCPRKDSKLDPLHEVMEPDGKIDPNKLEEWITKARLDPNDPENEDLIGK